MNKKTNRYTEIKSSAPNSVQGYQISPQKQTAAG
jgi:hypothetical protein